MDILSWIFLIISSSIMFLMSGVGIMRAYRMWHEKKSVISEISFAVIMFAMGIVCILIVKV